jgi:Protein of unknown function (DUF1592)/Protein of unknown function (DUF1588)/Protein of unknown function (DUF1595)/Protein of unknown function (DUF1585)
MTKFRLEWAWTLSCLVGCGGGIAQRTVAEAGADDGGAGGTAAVAAGGRASAGTGTTVGGSTGTSFPITAGMAGMLGTGGAAGGSGPIASACAVTPAPLRGLSTWEYRRSVQALTGAATIDGHVDDATREGPFAVQMSWSYVVGAYLLAEAERQGAAARDGKLLPCDVAKPVDAACATAFVDKLVGHAFRRPLTDAERSRYLGLFKLGSGQGDVAAGVELVVEAALISPIFLHKIYLGAGKASVGQTPLSGFEVASRLSYLLAGTPPDAALWDAAAQGELLTDAGVEAAARRLMDAPTFDDAVVHFHSQWLGLDQLELMLTSTFTPDLLGSMRTETERFVVDVFHGERTLTALLQSHTGFVDARLAPRYGVPAPVQDFAAVQLDPSRYFGVLTRASTLTRFNDPTFRGKFVRERLLCGDVPPPPPQIPPRAEVLPGQTRRQAWEQQQAGPACVGCHRLMDPIGYGFENFDELGLYRTTDHGLPVDASGSLVQSGDADGTFNGVGELALRLGQSPVVGKCMAKTWLSYAVQRPIGAADDCVVADAYSAAAKADLDLSEMLVSLVSSPQFRSRDAFVVPSVSPPPQVTGQIDTLQARRKLLLDFALGEVRWLKDGVPKEDLMLLDEYLTMLRDLETQLSQGVPPGPGPG